MNKADSEATPFTYVLLKTEKNEDWTEPDQPHNTSKSLINATKVKVNTTEIHKETLPSPHNEIIKCEIKSEVSWDEESNKKSRPARTKGKPRLNSAMLKSNLDFHVCAICEYKTKYKKVLQRHVIEHKVTEAMNNKMSLSSKLIAKAKETPRYPRRSLAGEPTTYKCPFCNCETSDKVLMSTHILRGHNWPYKFVKSYKCQHCEYEAPRTSQLVTHMDVHKTPRQFKCDICPYETKRKATLERHKEIHEMASVRTEYKSVMCLF